MIDKEKELIKELEESVKHSLHLVNQLGKPLIESISYDSINTVSNWRKEKTESESKFESLLSAHFCLKHCLISIMNYK